MTSSWFVLLLLCSVCVSKSINNNNEYQSLEALANAFPNANIVDLQRVLKASQNDGFKYIEDEVTIPDFACSKLPLPAATNNVNELKPGHVKVLMAMGDSITVAQSAKDTSLAPIREYRGLSFSIGSDPNVVTFPNLLKNVSSQTLYGSSTGIGNVNMATNGYNAAISGAVNKNMIEQAKWIISKLLADPKVNMANDWKVLTIWIGSNNLCDVCSNAAANNGQNFETQLVLALNALYESVPKLFVNLVSVLDISQLADITSGACGLMHTIACPCTSDKNKRALMTAAAVDYQSRALNISRTFNGKRSDFAVVVQPFLTKSTISVRSLLSTADCFHPSASCHAALATALWNNMLTPAASKKTTWVAGEAPICPDANSKFYTS